MDFLNTQFDSLSLYTRSVVLLLPMVFGNTIETSSKCHVKNILHGAKHECNPSKSLSVSIIVLPDINKGGHGRKVCLVLKVFVFLLGFWKLFSSTYLHFAYLCAFCVCAQFWYLKYG